MWDTRSRSRVTHNWPPRTRASCTVFQRGHADMRLACRGARANENGLGWPSVCACIPVRQLARHRQQTWRQRLLPPRPPRMLATCCYAAAPAQRFRGRTLEDSAPTPQRSWNHRAAATQHHCCQPATIAGCTPRCRQPSQHLRPCREREHNRQKIWPSQTTTPAAASPDPCLSTTNRRKIACEVLFTLLAVFGRATTPPIISVRV